MKNIKTKSLSPSGILPLTREIKKVFLRGFTLIELLVSISIIATLTAILLPNFMGARERARDAQKISDLNAVKNALRMYYNETQLYPVAASPISCDTLSASYPSLVGNLPGMSGIGCTYYSADTDTFDLCVGLDSGSGDEDLRSQLNCGASVSTGVCGLPAIADITRDKLFVVCAK